MHGVECVGMVTLTRAKKSCLVMSVWLLAAIMLLVQVASAAGTTHQLKSRLGCVPFVARSIEAMSFTEYLTTVLLNELERSGAFEVVERKRLESAMDMEGVRSDALGQDQLQRLGGRLGVDFLVSGSVSSQPQGMIIEITVLNVRGQRVVLTESLRMGESDVARVLQELAIRIRDAAKASAVPAAGAVMQKPLSPAVGLEAAGSTNRIRLRWKHPEPGRVIGYMVLRGVGLQGPFNSVGTVTDPGYSDEQLRLNETYFYKIVTVGQGGVVSEPTAVVQGATSVAPAVPIFMNAEPVLGGAVLTWRQRPCAGGDERTLPKGVRIYRRTSQEKEFVPITRVINDSCSFQDQGLADGTTYLYTMTAFNQAEAESEQSVQLSVTTPPVTSGLTAVSAKVRRVPLTWQMHPFTGVSGYKILRGAVKDGPYQEISSIADRLQTSYLDTGLSDKTTYWYRVVAKSKEQGTGGASSEVSATTRDVPPTPVKLLAGQGEPRRVTLTWESHAAPDDELRGYYLYRGEPGQDKLAKIAELSADTRSYRDGEEPLKDATSYSYAIASFNAGGAVSAMSVRTSATTKAVPTAPQGVTAVSGELRRITLSWKKNPEADIAEYAVFRQQGDSDFRPLKRTVETTLRDLDLQDGASYHYRVQAIDRDGLMSRFSDQVKGTTKAIPAPVEGLHLKDKTIRLVGWQKSAQTDVVRYHIYKKSFLGGQKLTTVEVPEWRCTEAGRFELYVTAVDRDGLESEPSAVLAVE
jgi:fibronectin type 3 domain-containing protein/TolB-like protein